MWKENLWNQHPALQLGLALTFGTAATLGHTWVFTLLIVLGYLNYVRPRHIYLLFAFATAGCLLVTAKYQFPEEQRLSGTVHFSLHEVQRSSSHFGTSWRCSGTVESLTLENGDIAARRLPATCYVPIRSTRPEAGVTYALEGSVRHSGYGHYYHLKPKKRRAWEPIDHFSGLAEWRYGAKEWLKAHIAERIPDAQAAALLSGLLTGHFDDRAARLEFGRLGLQHVMAVSGFHFAIVALFLALGLRSFLGLRPQAIAMLVGLSFYFVFVGPRPSVARAWIAVVLGWGGVLLGRDSSSLNALGIALICVVAFDPLVVESLGFQFSFLATAGILVFQQPCLTLVSKLFSSGGVLIQLLRQALALSLAVHVAVVPLILCLFHKFSLLGMFYNLVYPMLVSVALLMLMFGSFVPYLIDPLTTVYCRFLLALVHNAPLSLDYTFRVRDLPVSFVAAYLTIIFLFGLRALTQET